MDINDFYFGLFVSVIFTLTGIYAILNPIKFSNTILKKNNISLKNAKYYAINFLIIGLAGMIFLIYLKYKY
jgi:hypothetical protein